MVNSQRGANGIFDLLNSLNSKNLKNEIRAKKSEKIRAKSKKNLMKWSDRRRLVTKKHFLPFRVLLNVGIDPIFPQKIFFSFLALLREKFRFPAKTFLALQRLAQSCTIQGQTKVYELITKIE